MTAELHVREAGVADAPAIAELRALFLGLPASRWGYVSNMFVREEARDAGVGAVLLDA